MNKVNPNINNKKAHSTSQNKNKNLKLSYGKANNINQKNKIAVTTSKCIKIIAKSHIDLFSKKKSNKNSKSKDNNKSISNELLKKTSDDRDKFQKKANQNENSIKE